MAADLIYTYDLVPVNPARPLGQISASFKEFDKSLEASNARVLAFGASAGIILGVQRAFSSLIKETINIEKGLTDVNVILGLSTKNLQEFGSSLFDIGKNTGQSFTTIINAAKELSRQGLTAAETLQRTNDALILTRQSGLDAEESVKAITAALNSFQKEALTSTSVINKLANVDANFAVSSADLANAITRTGSAAEGAGVKFDELVGLVTAAQQTTQRGGAIIAQALNSVFARISRPGVIDQLKDLGVQINASQSGVEKLKALSSAISGATQEQSAMIKDAAGGVRNLNVLSAVLSDLNNKYSLFTKATQESANATDEAIDRNTELNKTYATLANRTVLNLQQVGAQFGKLTLGPGMEKVLGSINTVLEGAISKSSDSAGEILGQGLLKGLGQFLGGPGLILAGAAILKLVGRLAVDASAAFKTILTLNQTTRERMELEQSVVSILGRQPELIAMAMANERGLLAAVREVNMAFAQRNEMSAASALIAARMVNVGAGKVAKASVGFIPQMQETMGAKAAGYEPGEIKEMHIPNYGNVVYNTAEKVKYFPGMSQPAIMPPEASKGGQNYKDQFQGTYGFNPYKSGGHMPNFATYKKIPLSSNIISENLEKNFTKGEYFGNFYDLFSQRASQLPTGEGDLIKRIYASQSFNTNDAYAIGPLTNLVESLRTGRNKRYERKMLKTLGGTLDQRYDLFDKIVTDPSALIGSKSFSKTRQFYQALNLDPRALPVDKNFLYAATGTNTKEELATMLGNGTAVSHGLFDQLFGITSDLALQRGVTMPFYQSSVFAGRRQSLPGKRAETTFDPFARAFDKISVSNGLMPTFARGFQPNITIDKLLGRGSYKDIYGISGIQQNLFNTNLNPNEVVAGILHRSTIKDFEKQEQLFKYGAPVPQIHGYDDVLVPSNYRDKYGRVQSYNKKQAAVIERINPFTEDDAKYIGRMNNQHEGDVIRNVAGVLSQYLKEKGYIDSYKKASGWGGIQGDLTLRNLGVKRGFSKGEALDELSTISQLDPLQRIGAGDVRYIDNIFENTGLSVVDVGYLNPRKSYGGMIPNFAAQSFSFDPSALQRIVESQGIFGRAMPIGPRNKEQIMAARKLGQQMGIDPSTLLMDTRFQDTFRQFVPSASHGMMPNFAPPPITTRYSIRDLPEPIAKKLQAIAGQTLNIGKLTGHGRDELLQELAKYPSLANKLTTQIPITPSNIQYVEVDPKTQDIVGIRTVLPRGKNEMIDKELNLALFWDKGFQNTRLATAFTTSADMRMSGRIGTNVSNGLIPNFSPISDAISRELSSGVPASSIRVGSSKALVSPLNPFGQGIYNTVNEPGGLDQGIRRALQEGRDPKSYNVPNFALDPNSFQYEGNAGQKINAIVGDKYVQLANAVQHSGMAAKDAIVAFEKYANLMSAMPKQINQINASFSGLETTFKNLDKNKLLNAQQTVNKTGGIYPSPAQDPKQFFANVGGISNVLGPQFARLLAESKRAETDDALHYKVYAEKLTQSKITDLIQRGKLTLGQGFTRVEREDGSVGPYTGPLVRQMVDQKLREIQATLPPKSPPFVPAPKNPPLFGPLQTVINHPDAWQGQYEQLMMSGPNFLAEKRKQERSQIEHQNYLTQLSGPMGGTGWNGDISVMMRRIAQREYDQLMSTDSTHYRTRNTRVTEDYMDDLAGPVGASSPRAELRRAQQQHYDQLMSADSAHYRAINEAKTRSYLADLSGPLGGTGWGAPLSAPAGPRPNIFSRTRTGIDNFFKDPAKQNAMMGASFLVPMIAGVISEGIGDKTKEQRGAAQGVSSLANMASYTMLGGQFGGGFPGAIGGLAVGAILETPRVIQAFTDKIPDLEREIEILTERINKTNEGFGNIIITNNKLEEYQRGELSMSKFQFGKLKVGQNEQINTLATLFPESAGKIRTAAAAGDSNELEKLRSSLTDQETAKKQLQKIQILRDKIDNSNSFLGSIGLNRNTATPEDRLEYARQTILAKSTNPNNQGGIQSYLMDHPELLSAVDAANIDFSGMQATRKENEKLLGQKYLLESPLAISASAEPTAHGPINPAFDSSKYQKNIANIDTQFNAVGEKILENLNKLEEIGGFSGVTSQRKKLEEYLKAGDIEKFGAEYNNFVTSLNTPALKEGVNALQKFKNIIKPLAQFEDALDMFGDKLTDASNSIRSSAAKEIATFRRTMTQNVQFAQGKAELNILNQKQNPFIVLDIQTQQEKFARQAATQEFRQSINSQEKEKLATNRLQFLGRLQSSEFQQLGKSNISSGGIETIEKSFDKILKELGLSEGVKTSQEDINKIITSPGFSEKAKPILARLESEQRNPEIKGQERQINRSLIPEFKTFLAGEKGIKSDTATAIALRNIEDGMNNELAQQQEETNRAKLIIELRDQADAYSDNRDALGDAAKATLRVAKLSELYGKRLSDFMASDFANRVRTNVRDSYARGQISGSTYSKKIEQDASMELESNHIISQETLDRILQAGKAFNQMDRDAVRISDAMQKASIFRAYNQTQEELKIAKSDYQRGIISGSQYRDKSSIAAQNELAANGRISNSTFQDVLMSGTKYNQRDQYADLLHDVEGVRDAIASIRPMTRDAFASMVDGTKTASDAFRGLGISIATNVLNNVAKLSFDTFLKGIGSLFGSSSNSTMNAIGSIFGTHAHGGLISGYAGGGVVSGGSGIRDDVPAMLNQGSFVIKKGSANKYGKNFLDQINRGRGFDSGGGVNSILQNEFVVNKNGVNTTGEFRVSPGLSVIGQTDENSSANARKFATEQDYYNYLSTIEAHKSALKNAKKAENQRLIGAAVSAVMSAAGAAASGAFSSGTSSHGLNANSTPTQYNQAGMEWGDRTGIGDFGTGKVGFKADGGMIKRYAYGGSVDTVPALLTGGEYVMSKEAVNRMGTGFMERLNSGHVSPSRFATGGLVGKDINSVSSVMQETTANNWQQITSAMLRMVKVSEETRDILSGAKSKVNPKNDGTDKEKTSDAANTSAAPQVSIIINMAANGSNTSSQTSSSGSNDAPDAKKMQAFAELMKSVATQTIITELKPGGLLQNTPRK